MLNKIWGIMIILGIGFAVATGKVYEVSSAILSSGQEAVSLGIAMLGIMGLWCGIINVAEKAGAVEMLKKVLMPLLGVLFPDIPKNHKAMEYIAVNFAANFLGLGWAATPAGIKAMKELSKLNKNKTSASRSMCMFMVINMSSIQLISANILAYRTKYGSVNPAEIVFPSILATTISTLAGVVFCKAFELFEGEGR